jgi:hypothetical protein
MSQRKGLTAAEALESALAMMAEDGQMMSPAFKLACLVDVQTEATKLEGSLRKSEEADILRMQRELDQRMRSLGMKVRPGRPKGSKNKKAAEGGAQ